jgi:hypothetical protein
MPLNCYELPPLVKDIAEILKAMDWVVGLIVYTYHMSDSLKNT